MDDWSGDMAQVAEWDAELEELLRQVGDVFPRADLRRRAKACVRGLLGPVSRKNGWQLAEYAGWRSPDGQQHLLDRAKWDVDELRDRVRRYALDGLADSAGGVLVIDETGFAKKGKTSVGVARQFTGSLGGVFPCQIGVFAAWATTRGATLVDREIYLPQVWTGDRERCAAAQVPETVGFATKPRLAEKMIDRILPELAENTWLAADEVYGRDGAFRSFAESRQLPYVVNVSSAQTVLPRPGWRRIDKLAAAADESEWQLIEAGPSQTGSRWWQWWVRRVADPEEPVGSAVRGQPWPSRWMIARRRPETPDDLDYYLAWGPSGTPPEHLAHVAGARWRVEDAIKLGKHQCGLADYEVRHWHGWYRHITLSMLAAAFLAVQAATDDADAPAPLREALSGDEPDEEHKGEHEDIISPEQLIPYTAAEIRKLLTLIHPPPPPEHGRAAHGLWWSRWRRHHQADANGHHRRRRARELALNYN
ncbi:IS701 family transposase [Streptomyces mirabilis]|uniref:IS701 family transposase n=1 Tax=Streptomyces mirabilis TaxID=68239 RepID=UPI002257E127|nr:IS701 family transposase [Streptomyces mirabilis]MCX4427574.1 IS701 family transposase [Streptomyces mirabilis]